MPTITILTANREIHTQSPIGTLLSAVLQSELPSFALPCAGNHTCGKCRVQVSGQVSKPDAHELAFLSADDRTNGIRLACSCRISGDVTVTVHTAGPSKILVWNEIPTFTRTEIGYGIAVDIGTTTVAMQLFDRASGPVLAEQLAENAQRSHGADVISRIEACKTAGLDTLSTLIRDQLEQENIDDTGYLETEDEESHTIGDSTVAITQKDVRQIQLAKSAICAGLLTLMQESRITADEVARFHLAGGFGSSINYDSAAAIGLFPAALTRKTHFIGNGALDGAAMLLLHHRTQKTAPNRERFSCVCCLKKDRYEHTPLTALFG